MMTVYDEDYYSGKIRIENFQETFLASSTFWKIEDYHRQWIEALRNIQEGSLREALITSMYDPANAHFFDWWLLYREKDSICVQNQIFMFGESLLNLEEVKYRDLRREIPLREVHDEDGKLISEWTTSVNSVSNFYRQLMRDREG